MWIILLCFISHFAVSTGKLSKRAEQKYENIKRGEDSETTKTLSQHSKDVWVIE